MSTKDLSRLEEQIGRVLRVGVALCAVTLGLGLVLALAGRASASPLLRVGLVILMAIPVTRIAASFFDALRRRDTLLAFSTAIVLLVMALTLLYSLRSVDVDAADEVTHWFSVDPTLSTDGTRMAYVTNIDGRDQIFVVTPGKNDPMRLIAHKANDDAPAWSPDGKHVAFSSDITGSREIFVADLDGSNVQQVTHDGKAAINPSWAPDGERLAYSLKLNQPGEPERFEIVEIRRDGTGQRFITHDGAVATFPSWAPDGSRLVFRKVVGDNSEIFVVNADGTGERNLTNDASFDGWPAWSPDGKHIAFASDRRSQSQIFVMDPDGSNPRLLADTRGRATTPRWTSDSRTIYFTNCTVSGTNPDCRILRADLRK